MKQALAWIGLAFGRLWPVLTMKQAFGLTDRTLGYLVNVTLAFVGLNKNKTGGALLPRLFVI